MASSTASSGPVPADWGQPRLGLSFSAGATWWPQPGAVGAASYQVLPGLTKGTCFPEEPEKTPAAKLSKDTATDSRNPQELRPAPE